MVVHACHPSDSQSLKTRRTRSGWAKKQNFVSKITSAKRAGGAAQAVECLSSKNEALSTIPRTAKEKKVKN
jgi:hypothetical protein